MYVEIYFAKLNVAFAERLIINLIIELHLSILLLIFSNYSNHETSFSSSNFRNNLKIELISDIFILIYGNLKVQSKMKSRLFTKVNYSD